MTHKEKMQKYVDICVRAEKMGLVQHEDFDRLSHIMDIESADLKFNLRLQEWLEADDFNFAHDFIGIHKNIVREGFPATDFGLFVPRFAGRCMEGGIA